MKKSFIFALFLVILVSGLQAQTRDVFFVHGLNGTPQEWQTVASNLAAELDISMQLPSYQSNTGIANIADALYPQLSSNSVVVGHSMGGIVTREMFRDNANGNITALITTGTPHTGVMIAETAGEYVPLLVAYWTNALLAGPLSIFNNSTASYFVSAFLNLGAIFATDFVENKFGLNQQPATDLRRSSAFLSILNASPSQTFPAAHYVIYGAEDYNTIWRLGEAQSKNDVETGEAMNSFVSIVSWYYYAWFQADYLADYYYSLWTTQLDFDAYYDYITFRFIADQFFYGFAVLVYSQLDWDAVLTGAFVDWDEWYSSDAIVPSFSAAPAFVDAQRQRVAIGANHLELNKMHTEAYDRIRRSLIDVGVLERNSNPPPLSVSISGPTVLQSGNAGNYAASPSGGTSPYIDYRWWARNNGEFEPFSLSGIGPNAPIVGQWFELTGQRGQQSITYGPSFDFSLKCEVTDSAGAKATSAPLHVVLN